MDQQVLADLVFQRERLQKMRIAVNNRIEAMERENDEDIVSTPEYLLWEDWYERFEQMEQDTDKDIRDIAQGYPIIEEMCKIKGIQALLASQVVAHIDIKRATYCSSLWKYAGFGVENGERDRPRKGETLPYNARLKTACWKVATSMMRSNSPYRRIYDEARETYERRNDNPAWLAHNKPWTAGHIHAASIRKMIKIWLQHLWVTWRTMEGLATPAPWIIAHGGHHDYIAPEEFGWEVPTTRP